MKRFSQKLFAITALGLSSVGFTPASAGVVEYEGWLHGEKADEALDYAEENDIPVVLIKMFRETDCPLCRSAGNSMAAAKPNKQMIRIVMYVGKGSEGLNTERVTSLYRKVSKQVKDPSNWAPDMYYTTVDGRALGFVPYEEANESRSEGGTVLQISEWVSSVPGDVAKADKYAERGRYDQAIEQIDKILEEDAKISHLIQTLVGMAEKDSKMPETPVSRFFPDLRAEKVKAYEALAQKELEAARKLVAEEKLREAQRALKSLARGPEAFSTTEAAKRLLDEVETKLRDS